MVPKCLNIGYIDSYERDSYQKDTNGAKVVDKANEKIIDKKKKRY
jgi:hypothetical protein